MRRVLVTGGGGFVGGWLLRRLGPEAVPVGHGGRDGFPTLDVTDAAAVDALVAAVRPTAVVHLAALSSLSEAQAAGRHAWDVNLFGTMNLAEAVMRHVPEARFVFSSSSEIYGSSFNAVGGTADEATPLDPRNTYAVTKAAADLALGQMAAGGLRAVRIRAFNHTGPGQTPRFAVPAFAAQIAAAERGDRPPVMRVGNLEARRDFLDVRDVVEAYLGAIAAPDLPPGTILNVASGVPRRIGDILDALLAMSGTAITVEGDPALMRPSDIPVTAGDARRAAALLGWHPAIPWDTTLRDVLDHYRGLHA